MDLILTSFIPIALLVILLWGNKPDEDRTSFFNEEYTRVLKGACCIIVIFVHVPMSHGNVLQDAIGSFAYVAVTLFFMISAYGMYYSKQRKSNYLTHFWRNRLSSLLVPMLLINVVEYAHSLTYAGGCGRHRC